VPRAACRVRRAACHVLRAAGGVLLDDAATGRRAGRPGRRPEGAAATRCPRL